MSARQECLRKEENELLEVLVTIDYNRLDFDYILFY
jgi:hypothetical protein